MEFRNKLQELRKSRGVTQEELADAIFVTRTAVSKWESGRGYPSIDSLKALSRYFSVTIDELICTEEIMLAAEDEKKDYKDRYRSLICGLLDILHAVLLFVPVFGDGTGSGASVPLFGMTGVSPWIRTVFIVMICLTVLNGITGAVMSRLDRPVWHRHRLVTGMALSVLCSAVFVLTRQPYAGIVCFAILVIKGILILNTNNKN